MAGSYLYYGREMYVELYSVLSTGDPLKLEEYLKKGGEVPDISDGNLFQRYFDPNKPVSKSDLSYLESHKIPFKYIPKQILDVHELVKQLSNAIEMSWEENAKSYFTELMKRNPSASNKEMAIRLAIKYGNSDLVDYFMKNGATLDLDKALEIALNNAKLDVARLILSKRSGMSVHLYAALKSNNLNCINFSLENGAKISAEDIASVLSIIARSKSRSRFTPESEFYNNQLQILRFLAEKASPNVLNARATYYKFGYGPMDGPSIRFGSVGGTVVGMVNRGPYATKQYGMTEICCYNAPIIYGIQHVLGKEYTVAGFVPAKPVTPIQGILGVVGIALIIFVVSLVKAPVSSLLEKIGISKTEKKENVLPQAWNWGGIGYLNTRTGQYDIPFDKTARDSKGRLWILNPNTGNYDIHIEYGIEVRGGEYGGTKYVLNPKTDKFDLPILSDWRKDGNPNPKIIDDGVQPQAWDLIMGRDGMGAGYFNTKTRQYDIAPQKTHRDSEGRLWVLNPKTANYDIPIENGLEVMTDVLGRRWVLNPITGKFDLPMSGDWEATLKVSKETFEMQKSIKEENFEKKSIRWDKMNINERKQFKMKHPDKWRDEDEKELRSSERMLEMKEENYRKEYGVEPMKNSIPPKNNGNLWSMAVSKMNVRMPLSKQINSQKFSPQKT